MFASATNPQGIVLSPDQTTVYVAESGGTILRFNAKSGAPITPSIKLTPPTTTLNHLVFSPRFPDILLASSSSLTCAAVECAPAIYVVNVTSNIVVGSVNNLAIRDAWPNKSPIEVFASNFTSATDVGGSDIRRLDGVTSMAFLNNDEFIVAAGVAGEFGTFVLPHVLRFTLSLAPPYLQSASQFVPNQYATMPSRSVTVSSSIVVSCSDTCMRCRINPSTFHGECLDCTIANGGCDARTTNCVATSTGRNCVCKVSSDGLIVFLFC